MQQLSNEAMVELIQECITRNGETNKSNLKTPAVVFLMIYGNQLPLSAINILEAASLFSGL